MTIDTIAAARDLAIRPDTQRKGESRIPSLQGSTLFVTETSGARHASGAALKLLIFGTESR